MVEVPERTAGAEPGDERGADESIVRYRSAIAAAFGILGAIQLLDGVYAAIAPRSFYDEFPFGRGWVEALPSYSEHLVRDVGGLFLASGVVMLAAAWLLERRLVVVAAISYLAFSIPHTIYHYANIGVYGTGDALVNGVALAATVLVPLWVLLVVLTGRTSRSAAR